MREEASHGDPNAHVVYRREEAERWGIERAALKKMAVVSNKTPRPHKIT